MQVKRYLPSLKLIRELDSTPSQVIAGCRNRNAVDCGLITVFVLQAGRRLDLLSRLTLLLTEWKSAILVL